MTTARAFWLTAPGRSEIRSEILPDILPDTMPVRTLASGISRGTEALVASGGVPESQYDAMRAPLMAGEFPFPVKYGYAAVGRAPDGHRVFVLQPHQDIFIAPRAMCIAVPDAVPTRRAVLAANMETALNLLWDAAPLAGERVLVIGAGVLGLLSAALLARIPGANVTVADIDPTREAAARHVGCSFALSDALPKDQELIVHTSASESGLRLALAHAAFEGRIVEASWFGNRSPALPLGEAFHARRLRLVATQVGAVSPAMRFRRSRAERLALALDLLTDARFDILLEPATRFDDLPDAYPRLLAGGLCHVVTYEEA